ncbi:uncharacterized protein TM35_000881100 [Trypanosoma theileri]|uniref:Uncharacterized protein n=1 Tax=Trypanosoma theileri TaxID=67003 RepID=A0A1X0NEJ5_9TRYP|nr:uncharacterized protein TM35_000881100 [Trypanosoma theileri]ORC82531.1 hypothetical protein TM35_000881100 [Trypanosoma theileri]
MVENSCFPHFNAGEDGFERYSAMPNPVHLVTWRPSNRTFYSVARGTMNKKNKGKDSPHPHDKGKIYHDGVKAFRYCHVWCEKEIHGKCRKGKWCTIRTFPP